MYVVCIRICTQHTHTHLQVKGLTTTQAVVEASELDPRPIVNSYPYTYFDQYRIIQGELIVNFFLCLVATMVMHARAHTHALHMSIHLYLYL